MAVVGLVAAASMHVVLAQAPAPRTPWGEPDLQGTWTSEAELSVPFERPREYGNRQTMTDAEFAAIASKVSPPPLNVIQTRGSMRRLVIGSPATR
jgi:hypothetical protein